MLLAVDPSVRSPGAAILDRGQLVEVKRFIVKASCMSDGQRWLLVARTIYEWSLTRAPLDALVYERPQIYTWAKSKGDPNDLIGLAGVGAALSGILFVENPELEVRTPTPADWIGQVAKTTKGSAKESPRAKMILSRLSPAELALVPDQHDAIDAVGLGLWACGRLEPKRAYSNGR